MTTDNIVHEAVRDQNRFCCNFSFGAICGMIPPLTNGDP
jgi:hypothetical protein